MSKRESTFIYSAFTIAMLALIWSDAKAAEQPEMTLGASTAAPAGFLRFCADQPEACAPGVRAEFVQAKAKSVLAQQGELAGGMTASINWTQTFAQARAARLVAPRPSPSPQGFDWASVFAEARERRRAAAEAAALAEQAPVAVDWSSKTQKLLKTVNSNVNRSIARASDDVLFGRSDVWSLSLASGQNAGDCEDYVLEKRRALLDAGLPPQALSIAVVKTQAGQGHAVLLVNTTKGEVALDNLTPWIVPWNKTGYRWDRRQVAGSPFRWVSVEAAAKG